jgi:gliding motility-associated-like protein
LLAAYCRHQKKMNHIFTIALVVFLLSFNHRGYAQVISNMSFEGEPQANVAPQGWGPCNQYSTPDTQPGFWEVARPASHGKTYISLITRGNLGPYANITEAIQTQLSKPLRSGNVYDMSLDLTHSMEFGNYVGWDFLAYDTPAKLTILGGSTSCDKAELLWESPAINHTEWKRYAFKLEPKMDNINYLILEATHVDNVKYFGNVMIDNIAFTSCDDAIPIVTQAFDSLICENESIIIDASTPDGTYMWSDGSTQPNMVISNPGTYVVEVSNGCDTKILEYRIEEKECTCEITAPNIFSPNADGFNETFLIKGTSDIARYDLRIFNRWGQLVFSAQTINDHWSGRTNGHTVASGIYFWTVNMMCIQGSSIVDRTYKGWVTVKDQ